MKIELYTVYREFNKTKLVLFCFVFTLDLSGTTRYRIYQMEPLQTIPIYNICTCQMQQRIVKIVRELDINSRGQGGELYTNIS